MTTATDMVFFVGPVRTGSTWLHRTFDSATNVSLIEKKEIYYFQQNHSLDLNRYFSNFSVRGSKFVDISPTYFHEPDVPNRLSTHFGTNLKIFIVFRSHEELVWSQFQYMQKNGYLVKTFAEFMTMRKYQPFRDRFFYKKHIESWSSVFGLDNLVLLDFECFKKNPIAYFEHICKLIDVEYDLSKIKSDSVNNSKGRPRSFLMYRALVMLGRCVDAVVDRSTTMKIKENLIDPMMLKSGKSETLSEDDKKIIRDYYASDADVVFSKFSFLPSSTG